MTQQFNSIGVTKMGHHGRRRGREGIGFGLIDKFLGGGRRRDNHHGYDDYSNDRHREQENVKTISCKSCNANNQVDSKFCSGCGQALQQQAAGGTDFCGGCGNKLVAGAKFCADCGNKT